MPSINFPGQHHVWKLSPFLQMGSEPAMDSLLKALAWSAALVGLAASERINGDVFSLRSSAQSLRTGLRSFLGNPSLIFRQRDGLTDFLCFRSGAGHAQPPPEGL